MENFGSIKHWLIVNNLVCDVEYILISQFRDSYSYHIVEDIKSILAKSALYIDETKSISI